jgi:hypothetical protein
VEQLIAIVAPDGGERLGVELEREARREDVVGAERERNGALGDARDEVRPSRLRQRRRIAAGSTGRATGCQPSVSTRRVGPIDHCSRSLLRTLTNGLTAADQESLPGSRAAEASSFVPNVGRFCAVARLTLSASRGGRRRAGPHGAR